MSVKEKILYVDDESINVQLFEINFSNKFHVITGSSGFEGLELLKKHPDIKVVVSDMKMAGMNGVEFIQTVKPLYQNIVCFILTGYDVTPEIKMAIESKVITKYFKKPFDFKAIEREIEAVVIS